MEIEKTPAEKEKDIGNGFFKNKDFHSAIVHYSKAIVFLSLSSIHLIFPLEMQELDPSNSIYFSNRSNAYKNIGNIDLVSSSFHFL